MGVESGGVMHSLRNMILLSVANHPKSRAEIANELDKQRIAYCAAQNMREREMFRAGALDRRHGVCDNMRGLWKKAVKEKMLCQ